jgi:hypothetical protein
MARQKGQENLPIAVSTWGGFLATLAVLLLGQMDGTRAWILLVRAACAFLVVSGFLKLLTAGLIQVILWRGTSEKRNQRRSTTEIAETAQTIATAANPPEITENGNL